ncbi:hypothetical protein N3K66_008303 [Trichothecium roseum]|uniref:Uncharacterized protein n=1 Tax=Trichothecium roseum TaxID=47278 RepID=A0ACC0UT47_9HYPO|nr:hypothetical protein N3K66_008303 [Trichothecium roseum]
MYPKGPNPTKLLSAPRSPKKPVVLIHDGSGTTFAYFFIDGLNRDLWGLHDPNYWESKIWEGGLDAMAEHYIELIKKAGIKGEIILGGWSLGGTLSVKISRILADDPNPPFTVSGLLIIDTPKHGPYSQLPEPLMDPDPSKLPKLIQQSFANVDTYLEDWQLPNWNAATNNGQPMTARAAGKKYEVGPSKKLHLPVEGDWVVRETEPFKFEDEKPEKPLGPPPAVLIRGALYSKPPRETEQKCTIDRYRDEPMLGWDGRYPDFILASLDVDSAHYDLFDKMDEKKLSHVVSRIKTSLAVLDSIVEGY